MDEKTVVIEETENVKFLDRVKVKVKSFGDSVLKVLSENPMLIIPIITAVTAFVGGGIDKIGAAGDARYESCLSEDDVTGEQFLLKHPMTNDEILELGSRMVDGETKGSALSEMDLLRKDRRRK